LLILSTFVLSSKGVKVYGFGITNFVVKGESSGAVVQIDPSSGSLSQVGKIVNLTLFDTCTNVFGLYQYFPALFIDATTSMYVIDVATGEIEHQFLLNQDYEINNFVYDSSVGTYGVIRAIVVELSSGMEYFAEIDPNSGKTIIGPQLSPQLAIPSCQCAFDQEIGNFYISDESTLIALDVLYGTTQATHTFTGEIISGISIGGMAELYVTTNSIYLNQSVEWYCYYSGIFSCSPVLNFPSLYNSYKYSDTCYDCGSEQLYVIMSSEEMNTTVFTIDPFNAKIIETSLLDTSDYESGGIFNLFCGEEYC